jgi:hypothetical protein
MLAVFMFAILGDKEMNQFLFNLHINNISMAIPGTE